MWREEGGGTDVECLEGGGKGRGLKAGDDRARGVRRGGSRGKRGNGFGDGYAIKSSGRKLFYLHFCSRQF